MHKIRVERPEEPEFSLFWCPWHWVHWNKMAHQCQVSCQEQPCAGCHVLLLVEGRILPLPAQFRLTSIVAPCTNILWITLCPCGHNAWQMILLKEERLAWLRISENFRLLWWGEHVGMTEFMAAREETVIRSLHDRPESREHTAWTSKLSSPNSSPVLWDLFQSARTYRTQVSSFPKSYYQLSINIQKLNYEDIIKLTGKWNGFTHRPAMPFSSEICGHAQVPK